MGGNGQCICYTNTTQTFYLLIKIKFIKKINKSYFNIIQTDELPNSLPHPSTSMHLSTIPGHGGNDTLTHNIAGIPRVIVVHYGARVFSSPNPQPV